MTNTAAITRPATGSTGLVRIRRGEELTPGDCPASWTRLSMLREPLVLGSIRLPGGVFAFYACLQASRDGPGGKRLTARKPTTDGRETQYATEGNRRRAGDLRSAARGRSGRDGSERHARRLLRGL